MAETKEPIQEEEIPGEIEESDDSSEPSAPEEEKENSENQEQEEEESSEEQEEEPSEEGVDYKSELEREKKKRTQAEYNIERLKKEKKQEKEEEGDDSPLTAEEVRNIIREETQTFQREQARARIQETAKNLADSEAEAELILYHYENTINISGIDEESVREDLQNAKLLANRKRYSEQLAEAKRSNQSKSNAQKGAGTGGQKRQERPEPALSADDRKLMQRYNLTAKDIHGS